MRFPSLYKNDVVPLNTMEKKIQTDWGGFSKGEEQLRPSELMNVVAINDFGIKERADYHHDYPYYAATLMTCALKPGGGFSLNDIVLLRNSMEYVMKVLTIANFLFETMEKPIKMKGSGKAIETTIINNMQCIYKLLNTQETIITIADQREKVRPDASSKGITQLEKVFIKSRYNGMPKIVQFHFVGGRGYPVYITADFFKIGMTNGGRINMFYKSLHLETIGTNTSHEFFASILQQILEEDEDVKYQESKNADVKPWVEFI